MPSVRVIFNPVASRSRLGLLEAVSSVLSGVGWHAEIVETTGPGDAGELARSGVDEGIDVIAVYGGDGTISQAMAGLVGQDVPLAILPGGGGNQLARNLGIPLRVGAAARVITQGQSRRIDIGERRSGTRTSHFAVACGAGFDAQIMGATSQGMKRRAKMVAYFAQGVGLSMKSRPTAFSLTVDGTVTELWATTVLVANCPRVFPPHMRLRPGIAMDDGILDIVALNASGPADTLRLWHTLAREQDDPRRIRHLRGREVQVESSDVLAAQCDGDVVGTTPFTARVLPGALEVLTPAPH